MLGITLLLLVTAQSLQSASVPKENVPSSLIVFPADPADNEASHAGLGNKQAKPTSSEAATDEPAPCQGLTYCTVKPKGYPEEEFNEMFKGYKIPPTPTVDVLASRHGDNFQDDCDSEVTYEPLFWARENPKEAWRYVVQAPEKGYTQKIRIEKCRSAKSVCFKPFLPMEEFETSCEQVYGQWEVLVKAPASNITETMKIKLPICCSCKYKKLPFARY